MTDTVEAGRQAVLDVREPAETGRGVFPGTILIPLHQLRGRWRELPSDRPIAVTCAAGQRAYYAVRLLRQYGLDARNLSGGWNTRQQMVAAIAAR